MSFEAKSILGEAGGSRMNWMCIRHIDEGFGFGDRPAITCIDMTVHAPEHGRPNVVFSTYETNEISDRMLKEKFMPKAANTWEQLEFGRRILTNWKNFDKKDKIKFDHRGFAFD